MEIKFKKLKSEAHTPTRGSKHSAGYDLYACMDEDRVWILPHTTHLIGTGLAIQPSNGYFGAIFARSGLATKRGLRPANCIGVCDEDYTGEYMVAIHNDTDCVQCLENGERIAQLVFLPYLDVEFKEALEGLDKTDRGANGFGSTGTK